MPYNPSNPSRSSQRARQVRRFQHGQIISDPELELPLQLKQLYLQGQAPPKQEVQQEVPSPPQPPKPSPPAPEPPPKAESSKTESQPPALSPALAVRPPLQPLESVLSSEYILQTANAAISHFRVTEQHHYCCDYCSPGAEAILGYSVAELKQRPQLWRSQIWEADWENVFKPAMKKLLRIAQADPGCYYKSQFEFRFQRKSGFPGWMSTTVSCRYDPQTHYWYLTVVQIEIPAIDLERRDTSPHTQLIQPTSTAQTDTGHSNGNRNGNGNGHYANGNGYSNGTVTTNGLN